MSQLLDNVIYFSDCCRSTSNDINEYKDCGIALPHNIYLDKIEPITVETPPTQWLVVVLAVHPETWVRFCSQVFFSKFITLYQPFKWLQILNMLKGPYIDIERLSMAGIILLVDNMYLWLRIQKRKQYIYHLISTLQMATIIGYVEGTISRSLEQSTIRLYCLLIICMISMWSQ